MIRINLLPRKKKKGRSSAPVEGEQSVAIGMGIIVALAAGVFFIVHSPLEDDIQGQQGQNSKLTSDNKKIKAKTANFEEMKAAFKAAQDQAAAIARLNNSRSTPASFLFELSTLLRQDGEPSMTDNMRERVAGNENLRWQEGWDAKHIWLSSIEEKNGGFTLKGAAQSDGDVTQFAHRLTASMYFENVQPEGSVKKNDSKSGITLYEFTISGTVRY